MTSFSREGDQCDLPLRAAQPTEGVNLHKADRKSDGRSYRSIITAQYLQNIYMNWLWAGILAAAAAWQINKIIIRCWGDWGTIWVTPFLEEILKTGGAFILGANLILTHGIFGTIEAFYDLKTSREKGAPAALASFVGHLAFGLAANFGLIFQQSLWAAFFYGIIGHLAWNVLVSLLVSSKRKS